jgi:hypothetical protein
VYLRRVIEGWPRCYSPQSTGAKCSSDLRGWIIYSWIALPTVMYGGYAILRLAPFIVDALPAKKIW